MLLINQCNKWWGINYPSFNYYFHALVVFWQMDRYNFCFCSFSIPISDLWTLQLFQLFFTGPIFLPIFHPGLRRNNFSWFIIQKVQIIFLFSGYSWHKKNASATSAKWYQAKFNNKNYFPESDLGPDISSCLLFLFVLLNLALVRFFFSTISGLVHTCAGRFFFYAVRLFVHMKTELYFTSLFYFEACPLEGVECVRTPLDGGGEAEEGRAVVEREAGVNHIGRPRPRQAHQRRHAP